MEQIYFHIIPYLSVDEVLSLQKRGELPIKYLSFVISQDTRQFVQNAFLKKLLNRGLIKTGDHWVKSFDEKDGLIILALDMDDFMKNNSESAKKVLDEFSGIEQFYIYELFA